MSQAALASKIAGLGVTLHPSAIAKMELRGASSPRTIRLNEAVAIARALEVTLDDLVSPYEEDEGAKRALQRMLIKVEARHFEYFERVNAAIEARVELERAVGDYRALRAHNAGPGAFRRGLEKGGGRTVEQMLSDDLKFVRDRVAELVWEQEWEG